MFLDIPPAQSAAETRLISQIRGGGRAAVLDAEPRQYPKVCRCIEHAAMDPTDGLIRILEITIGGFDICSSAV